MRKSALIVAVAGVPSAGWMSVAEAEIILPGGALNGSLTLVSNYVTRGISNSDGKPALQVLAEYDHRSGAYLGGFVSNVDFDDSHNAKGETDIWGGYMARWRGVTFRADALAYFYPGVKHHLSDDFNTIEFESSAALAAIGCTFELGFAASPNYFFNSGRSYYYEFNATVPLFRSIALEAHVGHQDVEKNHVFGMPDYNDWQIGFAAAYGSVKAGLYYADTSVSRRRCFAGKDWCGPQAIAQLGYVF